MHPFEELVLQRIIENLSLTEDVIRQDTYTTQIGYGQDFWMNVHEQSGTASGGYLTRGLMYFQSVLRLNLLRESDWEKQFDSERDKWIRMWKPGGLFVAPFVPNEGDASTELHLEDFALRDSWCAVNHVKIASQDELGRPIYGEGFYKVICSLFVRVVRELHQSGEIRRLFGRDIGVFLVDADALVQCKAVTEANPPELIAEFLRYSSAPLLFL